MNLTSMFDRICSSNIIIASQQRNEPDLTYEQKHEILNNLYKTNPINFIYRFGSLLTDDELKQNFDSNDDYIRQILNSNRHKRSANRRYTYMQQLIADGSYFSDEAMKERSPLLYEQMIEKYNDNETKQLVTRTANGPLADFYMEHLEAINHQERVEKEFENEEHVNDDDDSESESDDDDENEQKYSSTEKNLYRQEFLAIQKEKFLNGEDSNIDYTSIDNNENLDDIKIRERDEEEKYFDDEDPYTYINEER
ncbi:unnamed protein product [Rotaria sordida]|uniref:CCD97-like C-terminal domain-containing protein n=1 Tax=Rotaria sordida TaxID=392033 RepID=A0A815BRZ6_9BILA|nr:unnamed protein product [Rotaria sordida]CAF1273834.1 unnamed protein product [Rotaria sordida]CAF3794473.1 unnamed protein product [Rotaria sordida]CAF3928247.1 unnamed protein product [Rotaria sordida]